MESKHYFVSILRKSDVDHALISSYFESMNHVGSFQSLIEQTQGDIHFDWVQNGLTGLLMAVQRNNPILTKIFLETDSDISRGDGEVPESWLQNATKFCELTPWCLSFWSHAEKVSFMYQSEKNK